MSTMPRDTCPFQCARCSDEARALLRFSDTSSSRTRLTGRGPTLTGRRCRCADHGAVWSGAGGGSRAAADDVPGGKLRQGAEGGQGA
eukprot:763953-Prorocentrum_minimum.AAC.1